MYPFRPMYLAVLVSLACGCNKPRKTQQRPDTPVSSFLPSQDDTAIATATPSPSPSPFVFACPKYPVVFAHGFMGGKRAGFFVDVVDHFKAKNCTVFHAEVPAIAGVVARGNSLATQIEKILSDTAAKQVNIVAHSQGGLDARYVISATAVGKKVASLTTLSTPHRGSPVATFALSTSQGEFAKEALSLLGNLISGIVNSNTVDADTRAAIESLSVDYVTKTFNPAYPDVAGVYYQSWGARTGGISKDQTKLVLKVSQMFLQLLSGDNDGMVPVESAKWGNFRGVLDADHLDIVGLKLGDTKSPFNHLEFLEQTMTDLATRQF